MMKITGLLFCALGLLAMPPMVNHADASLKGCLKGIKSCAKKGKKLKGAIKAAKTSCQALRGCKKECRGGKKGCLAGVREGKLGSAYAKLCRKGKRACISTCKDLYKTPECRAARDEVFTHAAEGGARCSRALAACTPSPAIDCAAAILGCSGKEATAIKPLANTVYAECKDLRTCKKGCRGKDRKLKPSCKKACRDSFKTAECKKARRALVEQSVKSGLKCGSRLLACLPI